MPARVAHDAAQQSSSAGVDERMHVVVQPCVGTCWAMEPDRVVQANHALGVAFEMQWPTADSGPVGGETEESSVEMLVVRELGWNPKPHAVSGLPGPVRGEPSRPEVRGYPWARTLLGPKVRWASDVPPSGEVIDVAVEVGRERARHLQDGFVPLGRVDAAGRSEAQS